MPTSALQAAILTWMEQHLEAAIVAALQAGAAADTSTPGINAIQAKVTQVMSSIADIQNLLAAETSAEEKVLAVVQSQSATISTLQSQLATAAAGSDAAGIASVLSQMQTNIDHLNAVSAAISTATTPTDTTQPTSGAVVPPGQPVIS